VTIRRTADLVACLAFIFAAQPWTGAQTLAGDTNAATHATEIVVTASPLPGSAGQLGRSVEIVGSVELRNSGALSVGEALETLTSVSVSERGATEVQSDLSIRGSTFQQVLLTLDGFPLTDPQTAHHNMDLPLPIDAVETITVIPGPGSSLFGPSAFAGVVDLSPRIPEASGLRFHSGYGSFGTRRFGALADYVEGRQSTTFAVSYSDSEGFQEGTDYETLSFWGSSVTDFDAGSMRISIGHTDKDFGARDFYASYPSREETAVTLVDVAPMFEIGSGWSVKAIARYRHHEDEFVLIEDNPDYYWNQHTSESFTERLTLTSPAHFLGTTAFGVERSDASLDSSNLGDRNAFVNSGFIQHRIPQGIWGADLGLRADDYDRWGTEIFPSIGLSAKPDERIRIHASVARGIRPPSFTELYYTDPANISDPDLEPEEAWGGEAGAVMEIVDDVKVSVVYFHRRAENLIDWVRSSAEEAWQVSNIGEAMTRGGEIWLVTHMAGLKLRPSYRYADLDAESQGIESKYALNVPEHDAGLYAGLAKTHGFHASVAARYRDTPTLNRYWLLNAKVSKEFGRLTIYVLGKNLLDEEYEEIPSVPTAGVYGEAGLEVNW